MYMYMYVHFLFIFGVHVHCIVVLSGVLFAASGRVRCNENEVIDDSNQVLSLSSFTPSLHGPDSDGM